jgi:restriction system protein
MPVPDYETIMKPLLEFLADKKDWKVKECTQHIQTHFKLTPEEIRMKLPSGANMVSNRVGWAKTYLKKAGLIETPKRGIVKITKKGLELLTKNPNRITKQELNQYADFRSFIVTTNDTKTGEIKAGQVELPSQKTPEEELEEAMQTLNGQLEEDLLEMVLANSPEFFERLVVDLIIGMGYGGSKKEAGEAIGGTGDKGIDGIIREDRLGLDMIYIQAKRYNSKNSISRQDVQAFAGALQGQRAKKGVFITTSYFTTGAQEYVDKIDNSIILINGQRLVELMMEFNVGVQTKQVFELKRIDSDYFEE